MPGISNHRTPGSWDGELQDADQRHQAQEKHHKEVQNWATDQMKHQCFINGVKGNCASLEHQLGNPLPAVKLKGILEGMNQKIVVVPHPLWPDTWTISVPRLLETPRMNMTTGVLETNKLQYLCAYDGPLVPEFTLMGTHEIEAPSVQKTYTWDDPMVRKETIPWRVANPGWRSIMAKLALAGILRTVEVDRKAAELSIHTNEAWQAMLGKSSSAQLHM